MRVWSNAVYGCGGGMCGVRREAYWGRGGEEIWWEDECSEGVVRAGGKEGCAVWGPGGLLVGGNRGRWGTTIERF
jgi:hypothetical protein